MRLILVVMVASCWLSPGVGFGQEMARAWGSCARCHGTPDSRLAPGRLWIERIGVTACVQPLAPGGVKQRDGLRAFLSGADAPRPVLVRKGRKAAKGEGLMTVPFKHGSVLLMPTGHHDGLKPVRLVWGEDNRATRAVPAGSYKVRNYRVVRHADDGTEWQLWASGKGRKVTVTAGETTKLDLDLKVHVRPNARARGKKLQVGIGVTGDSRMGATVIRAGKRVPARYLLVRGDVRLDDGDMSYG